MSLHRIESRLPFAQRTPSVFTVRVAGASKRARSRCADRPTCSRPSERRAVRKWPYQVQIGQTRLHAARQLDCKATITLLQRPLQASRRLQVTAQAFWCNQGAARHPPIVKNSFSQGLSSPSPPLSLHPLNSPIPFPALRLCPCHPIHPSLMRSKATLSLHVLRCLAQRLCPPHATRFARNRTRLARPQCRRMVSCRR